MLRLRESAFVVLSLLAVYLLLCLASFDARDPGWTHSIDTSRLHNMGGVLGAWLADFLLSFFGIIAYTLPLLLFYAGFRLLRERGDDSAWVLLIYLGGFVLAVSCACGLAHLNMQAPIAWLPSGVGGGGILGQIVVMPLIGTLGLLGATLLLLAFLLTGVTFFSGISWLQVMDRTGYYTLFVIDSLGSWYQQGRDWLAGRKARVKRDEVRREDTRKRAQRKVPQPKIEPRFETTRAQPKPQLKQQPLFKQLGPGELPSLELLDEAPLQARGFSNEELQAMSRQVELKLADFGVEVEVVEVHPGPVITRFELLPAAGVKGVQISNLAKDLARGLSVISVRVVDVIPGKSVIGLEIPNQNREIVYLRDVLESKLYQDAASPLTLGLGKSIGGEPVVADISKMPHLLVAGTTGSGKSVAVNSMILSLVYKATADQVRMIMIDPKMLELSVYEGIPHLLAPVVTDMKQAANALRWCVVEMDRRYRLMSELGVRNLAGLNKKLDAERKRGKPLTDPMFQPTHPEDVPPELDNLPYIVVIVDEFADMMMVVGKKVEELIARLAQKARAAGIHLILATQRPSVDVITGLIKANIPTRMAFQVSSKIDSRTILDQPGAEQLLGHGDMLFLPPGSGLPERVHGAFVDDHEVHAIAESLRSQGEPSYLDDVLNDVQTMNDGQVVGETGLPEAGDGEADELYDRAVRIVTESRRASISSVQRQLRIGYNRAARLIEEMEAAGIVSPPEHNNQREVLAPPPPKD
ncbi:MAG: DNA translocase FtsK [Wenzhouxiangellaceae bacterium]